MGREKICKGCGQRFVTTARNQRYCTESCRVLNYAPPQREEKKKPKKLRGQICWYCEKAAGGCSWSKRFIPVEGWVAKKTKREGIIGGSYRISYCPEFIQERSV